MMEDDESKENTSSTVPILKPKLSFKRPGLFKAPGFNPPAKKPASETAANPAPPTTVLSTAENSSLHYFTVLYTKYSNKKLRKNKSFNDGVLEIKPGNKATLYAQDGGKPVITTVLRGYNPTALGEGSEIVMGNWEVEVQDRITKERFTSGEAFLNTSTSIVPTAAAAPSLPSAMISNTSSSAPFCRPVISKPSFSGLGTTSATQVPRAAAAPLHDPHAPNAVVLNANEWNNGKGYCNVTKRPTTPVVLDPLLARHMRPHQISGVQFLYDCVVGIRDPSQLGAILADAMGLGKTLTTLALLWTLLKQGPFGKPLVSKALVVTPSSLCRNWAAETKKWLGDERLRTLVIQSGQEGAQQALDFKHGSVARIGIISYETLRQHAATLAGCAGIIVADEGHRLKSAAGNKTISALLSLRCQRRIILSGTPLQNNLSEFFAMCDFVCPAALGSLSVFNRIFASPIAKGRDKNASEEERALGESRSEELQRRVEGFVLRRGAEINSAYLPPLSTYVVFCKPTQVQLEAYSTILGSGSVKRLLAVTGADFGDQVLKVLSDLRKVCNHPSFVANAQEEEGEKAANANVSISSSGKLATLDCLLSCIITDQSSRCVVVSQSTTMLDLIGTLCTHKGYSTVRIDGSIDPNKRQDIVDGFNRHGIGQIFLLSTTAGGAGLNLTGASRLILVDSHWNPAMDQQAMSRVWRDGQKQPCVVYRLVTTGTMEEKVYQRQRAKGEIAAMTVASGSSNVTKSTGAKGQFSKEELRQLFTLRKETDCDTADVLGREAFVGLLPDECEDVALRAAMQMGLVSYVHLESRQNALENDENQVHGKTGAEELRSSMNE